MTELKAQELVMHLLAAYPATTSRLDKDQVKAVGHTYRRMLRDLPFPEAGAAVEHLIATSKYLPTVAEIRMAAVTVVIGQPRAGAEGWEEFLAAVRRYGYMREPGVDFTFADPVTAKCVDCFGWKNLCSSENAVADRARFIDLYEQLSATVRIEAVTTDLPARQRLREFRQQHAAPLSGAIGAAMKLLAAPAADDQHAEGDDNDGND